METLKSIVLKHVLAQLGADAPWLAALPYANNWQERIERTINAFVPHLVEAAPALIQEVTLTLNSPQLTRETWQRLNSYLQDSDLPMEVKQDASIIEAELARESHLLTKITGTTVSILITDFLCRAFPDLQSNSSSNYPDLYFSWADYSILPRRNDAGAVGPAVRGKHPTSVPDGIEIKSNRGKTIRVDCHNAHQGLHLAMTFNKVGDRWHVYDVYLAYLRREDYTEATRNADATTVKFSFRHAPFISVTTGQLKEMESAE